MGNCKLVGCGGRGGGPKSQFFKSTGMVLIIYRGLRWGSNQKNLQLAGHIQATLLRIRSDGSCLVSFLGWFEYVEIFSQIIENSQQKGHERKRSKGRF